LSGQYIQLSGRKKGDASSRKLNKAGNAGDLIRGGSLLLTKKEKKKRTKRKRRGDSAPSTGLGDFNHPFSVLERKRERNQESSIPGKKTTHPYAPQP